MYTNEAIATFLASANIDGMYAYYAFPFFLVKNAAENIYGAKLLNQELIRAATLALPRLKEQSTIATFLDRETAKIDALIAEQQRLIELLKEKRQAVISHAVTKGLTNLPGANLNAGVSDGGPKGERRDSASSPDTTMKDSGIEWLG